MVTLSMGVLQCNLLANVSTVAGEPQIFVCFGVWAISSGAYPRFCAKEALLPIFRAPYGVPKIKLWLAKCKARTLPTVLSLRPCEHYFGSDGSSILSFRKAGAD